MMDEKFVRKVIMPLIDSVYEDTCDFDVAEIVETVCDKLVDMGYHVNWYQGATRAAFVFRDFDEVIKVPLLNETKHNYCELEVRNYKSAVEYGVDQLLLPIAYFDTCECGLPLYFQPKYRFTTDEMNRNWWKKKRQSQLLREVIDTGIIENLVQNCYRSRVSYQWLTFVYLTYGKAFTKRFIRWTNDHKINDLHANNTGFLKRKPIILDYAGICDDEWS